jgi:hypothetical protein
MKKIIFLLLLVINTSTLIANNTLVVHLQSGTKASFTLTTEPIITFSGTNMIITCGTSYTTYGIDDVSYYDYDDVETDISTIKNKSNLSRQGDVITLSLLNSGSRVNLYNVEGQLIISKKADTRGNLTINLSTLSKGVYLLKSNTLTIKISKQ